MLKVCTFGPILISAPLTRCPYCFPLKMDEIQKIYFYGKFLAYPICLSKYVKIKAVSLLPFQGKIRLLFALLGLFLAGNRIESQIKRVRIKIWHILFYPHSSWASFCNKSLVSALPSFAAIACKKPFRKNFSQIFKFGCFSKYHAQIFDKDLFDFLSFMANQVAPIWNIRN